MTTPITIVIPTLEPGALLEQALLSLAPELARRAAGDEVLVVDDSGTGAVAAALHERTVRVLALPENVGFARALGAGIAAARHPLVFAMNSDVRVRPGFVEPLVEAFADERVFAAVPRILLGGVPGRVESLVRVRLEGGIARAVQPLLEGEDGPPRDEAHLAESVDVAFPIGGACLLARERFAELGGFDPAFEPFYLEDLDLGWRAWRAGWTCRYVGRSIVEHHHRATIGARIPPAVVLAAIERNRLLFTWKHVDLPDLTELHVRELARRVADARAAGDRAFLEALCLALEDRRAVLDGRSPVAEPSFERIRRASDPF